MLSSEEEEEGEDDGDGGKKTLQSSSWAEESRLGSLEQTQVGDTPGWYLRQTRQERQQQNSPVRAAVHNLRTRKGSKDKNVEFKVMESITSKGFIIWGAEMRAGHVRTIRPNTVKRFFYLT